MRAERAYFADVKNWGWDVKGDWDAKQEFNG
jgi:hypothetical protein